MSETQAGNEMQKTPPKGSTVSSHIKSTPQNIGTASASSYISDMRRPNTSKWIAYDLKHHKQTGFIDMLRYFAWKIVDSPKTGYSSALLDKILEKVDLLVVDIVKPAIAEKTNDQQWTPEALMRHASNFINAKTEDDSYAPWVKMTNTALWLLKGISMDGILPYNSQYEIIMQRNDPNLLKYDHNGRIVDRKPDTVFLTLETAQKLHSAEGLSSLSWKQIAGEKAHAKLKTASKTVTGDLPKPYKLDWIDTLGSSEHKTTGNKARSEMKQTPAFSKSPNEIDRNVGSKRKSSDDKPRGGRASKLRKMDGDTSVHHSGGSTWSLSPALDAIPGGGESNESDNGKSVEIQAAEYAIGRLGASYAMTHAFNCVVKDSTLSFIWYDREGIIQTTGFDLASHLNYYLAFLFIIQRFREQQWGVNSKLLVSNIPAGAAGTDEEPGVLNDSQARTKSGAMSHSTTSRGCFHIGAGLFELVPSRIHHKQWGVKGRATAVLECKEILGSGYGRDCVLKVSFPQKSRMLEKDILEEAEKLKHAEVEGHIPEVVACQVFEDISTDRIREVLGLDVTSSRWMVAIVFVKLEGEIRSLFGPDYWKVWWDCFACHRLLWADGIHHRDISDTNLMYKRDPETGTVIGVLADFDLASMEKSPRANTERTGTVPFMAMDLLDTVGLAGETVHEYHHDVESFLWVAVMDNASYEEGKYVQGVEPFSHWRLEEATSLSDKQLSWMRRGWSRYSPTESQKVCWGGFTLVRMIVWRLMMELNPEPALFSRNMELLHQELLLVDAAEIIPANEERPLKDPNCLYLLMTNTRDHYQTRHPEVLPQPASTVAPSQGHPEDQS